MAIQKPGIHANVYDKLSSFTQDEKNIVQKIAKEWYITSAGSFKIAQRSEYRHLLIKATPIYQEMFGFERELIVIFSPYEIFQARSVDAIDNLYDSILKKYQTLRIERICSVILSKDNQVEEKIRRILKESQESQVVIPISYAEILGNDDPYFLRNKFKNNFYSRDLFDFESPLRKDLYVFGRTDLINKIGDRHFSNENSGLFGLRKSGKTSFVYALQRQLDKVGAKSILISCDDTSFQNRRWNECLHYRLYRIVKEYKLQVKLAAENKYTEKDASILFEEDVCKIYNALNRKSILIIFDEIERITFNISSSSHWKSGKDFILFWQTLRSKFQGLENIFSYLIAGTNPSCIEASKIVVKELDMNQGKTLVENQYDNPIFNSISIEYLERFDVHQTREMVGKLGNFMGLEFEETIYSKLTEDYGGHPFLIRQVCSLIHQQNKKELPILVDRILYSKAKEEFEQYRAAKYIKMMLDVLIDFYPDEYTMLESLAIGNMEFFNAFVSESPEYTAHLKGYGIISQNRKNYDFKIDAVKN